MALYIFDKQHFAAPDLESLRLLLIPVLTDLEIVDTDIEIELLDDQQIAQLNEKFFSRSRPTNVISFPLVPYRLFSVQKNKKKIRKYSDKSTYLRADKARFGCGIFVPALDKESGHLGNVVVSVETVGPETRALGYTLEEGIVYYLIHGILHLLGFEHVDVDLEVASLMEKRQDELFELVLNRS